MVTPTSWPAVSRVSSAPVAKSCSPESALTPAGRLSSRSGRLRAVTSSSVDQRRGGGDLVSGRRGGRDGR